MRQAVNANTSTIASGLTDFYNTSGTANAIVLTSTNSATSLTNGLHVRFKSIYENTDTVTVNLNNLGAKNVTIGGTNITAGKIKANKFYELTYSSSTTSFELLEVETLPTQSGNNNTFLKTNGTSTSWANLITELANFPTSQYINGLKITKNSSSPDDTIDISTGSCLDSTNTKILVLANTTSKQKTDFGSSVTYYVYLIAKADLSAYDILITTSSSSPTLPTDYTLYRLIGNLITNSSGDIENILNSSSDFSLANTQTTRTGEQSIVFKTGEGYLKLPNGFIIQWIYAGGSYNGNTYSFPIAFPNACVAITTSNCPSNPRSSARPGCYCISNSQFVVTANWVNGAAAGWADADIIAIGY